MFADDASLKTTSKINYCDQLKSKTVVNGQVKWPELSSLAFKLTNIQAAKGQRITGGKKKKNKSKKNPRKQQRG